MLTIADIYKNIWENFPTNEVILYMETTYKMIPILYDIRLIYNSL